MINAIEYAVCYIEATLSVAFTNFSQGSNSALSGISPAPASILEVRNSKLQVRNGINITQ